MKAIGLRFPLPIGALLMVAAFCLTGCQAPRQQLPATVDSTLSVKRSPAHGPVGISSETRPAFKEYDTAFIAAVQERWYTLLDTIPRKDYNAGKVRLAFKLHSDGRITDLIPTHSTVSDVFNLACQKAILDPAPFKAWPADMRELVGKDVREITFSFYYN